MNILLIRYSWLLDTYLLKLASMIMSKNDNLIKYIDPLLVKSLSKTKFTYFVLLDSSELRVFIFSNNPIDKLEITCNGGIFNCIKSYNFELKDKFILLGNMVFANVNYNDSIIGSSNIASYLFCPTKLGGGLDSPTFNDAISKLASDSKRYSILFKS